jgi:hypothetical protein
VAKFPSDVLSAIAEHEEVEIETGGRRTIIWIVVEGSDVYVRSVRGERGRWYQDLLADPKATIHFRGRPKITPVAVRAVSASDPESVSACSRALELKYARHGSSLKSMLRPDTLPTTVRLDPL